MAESDNKAPPDGLEGSMAGAKKIVEILKGLGVVAGALTALVSGIRENIWAFAVGLGVFLLSAGWYGVSRWRRRRRRQRSLPVQVPPTPKVYLRGLLPFEKGEALLGRDLDLRQLRAKITSSEFRFGYISGEAGSGKTSLLRAGLLSEAEKINVSIVYTPKPGANPADAIAHSLKAEFGEQSFQAGSSLPELLATAQRKTPSRRLLIVVDQFEEFFVVHRTAASRRPFIKDVEVILKNDDPNLGFLFALRKEFVDDLQEFKGAVPQPLDVRFSHRLSNWEVEDALDVLRNAALHDGAPFAEALQEEVVKDLGQSGEVRPVELQIVADHLLRQRIFNLAQYKKLGRADGILKSYIHTVIEPAGAKTPELERQIARHLLRCLCDGVALTKRPTGLRFAELEDQIRAGLAANGLGDLSKGVGQFREALRTVLQRCASAYLILLEAEATYNLVHDYLVRPILDATSDVEPVEEQANRLLEQYLEQQRRDRTTTISWRHYRFITKYASRDRKVEGVVARLLVRTRRRRTRIAVGVVLGAFTVGLLIQPPGVRFTMTRTIPTPHYFWSLAKDRRLAVAASEDHLTTVWSLSRPWEQRLHLPISFRYASSDSDSRYLCGVTKNGGVHVWRTDKPLRVGSKPVMKLAVLPKDQGDRRNQFRYGYCGFSPDGEWAYGVGGDGRVWLVPSEGFESVPAQLYFEDGPLALLRFSPGGKYVAALTLDGSLTIVETGVPKNRARPPVRFSSIKPSTIFDETLEPIEVWRLVFDSNERWVVGVGEQGGLHMMDLKAFPVVNPISAALPNGAVPASVVFDPSNERIFAGAARSLYSWRVEDLEVAALVPVGSAEKTIRRYVPRVRFSRNSLWIVTDSLERGLLFGRLNRKWNMQMKYILPEGINIAEFGFSPDSNWLVGSTFQGSLYLWKVGRVPRLASTGFVSEMPFRILWCSNSNDFLLMSFNELFWIQAEDGKSESLMRIEKAIFNLAVTPDRDALVVFQPEQILFFRRQLKLWGVPLYDFPLPELDQEEWLPEWN